MSVTLKPGESFSLTVTAGDDGGNLKPYYIKEAVDTEKERLESLLSNSGLPETDNARALLRASDQLIAPRVLRLGTDDKGQEITECYTSIIAGIPWLKDWSRGTMISLPGILLVPKRYKEAKSVLSMWAKYMDHGQIPNTFDFEKYDKPQFGGMDGALYWFNALDEFNQAVEGAGKLGEYKDFIHDQYDALKNVVDCHIYGRHSYKTLTGGNDKEIYDEKAGILEEHQVEGNKTLAGILEKDEDKGRKHVGPNWLTEQVGMEPDGLIAADEDHLTWMDGRDKKNNDKTYVPREGKAVEINALWYNALCVMKDLAEEFGENDNANKYGELSELVKESMKNFKNTSEGGLYDLIDVKRGDKTVDASIRPNQVIAISLNHSPFDDDKDTMKSVLNVAEEHLLTPMGLRTLSPDDPQYEPYYGDFDYDKRESANHKGTVWPWLIGPYCKAYLKVHGDSIKTHQEVYKLIKPLLNHMNGEAEMKYHAAGGNLLGAISEIADGGKYEEREVNRNDKKIADSPKAKPPLGCEDDSYDDDKACLLKCEDPPAVRLLDKEDPKEKRKTNCYDHMQKGCFTQALSDASVLDIYNRVKDVAEVEETKDGKRKEVKCRSPYIS
jgi:glycogen debranching enzyme